MDVEVNEEGQLKVVFDEELEKFRKELSAERNKINSFFNQRKYKFKNELTKIEENAYKNFLKDEKLKGIAEEVFGKYITKFIREMFGENVQDLRQFGFRFVDFQNFISEKFREWFDAKVDEFVKGYDVVQLVEKSLNGVSGRQKEMLNFVEQFVEIFKKKFGENIGDNAIAQMIETLGWEMKSIREGKKNKSSKDDWYV